MMCRIRHGRLKRAGPELGEISPTPSELAKLRKADRPTGVMWELGPNPERGSRRDDHRTCHACPPRGGIPAIQLISTKINVQQR